MSKCVGVRERERERKREKREREQREKSERDLQSYILCTAFCIASAHQSGSQDIS